MPRFVQLLDRLIDAGLIAVLVFAAVAFGSVEEWARATGQILIWVVFAAWVCKVIWAPVHGGHQPGSFLGGRIRLSGLEWPALMFAGVLLLQLVPLPPRLVQVISPRTAEIYTRTLPAYGQPTPTFAGLPRWLQQDPEARAGEVPGFPADPEYTETAFPPEWFEVAHAAWRPLSLSPSDTRRALEVFLAHLALFVVAFHQLDRRGATARYVMPVAILAGVLAAVGILQYLTGDGKIYWFRQGGEQFGFGPFVNANNFAGWMELALPLTAAIALTAWRGVSQRPRDRPSLPGVVLFGFMTILGLAAFVLAQSRGGMLALLGALFLALLALAIRGRLRWKPLVFGAVPLALAVGIAAWIDLPRVSERYETLTNVTQERSFKTRLQFSRRALEIAADFPALGSGMGAFREIHTLYNPGTSNRELARAHNDYAQVASECGLFGVAAMLWALVLIVSRGVIPGLLRPPDDATWVVRMASIGVLALLLHSFVDFNLQIYSNSLLFVFLCALLMFHAVGRRMVEGQTP